MSLCKSKKKTTTTETDIEIIEFILKNLYNTTENRITVNVLKIQLKTYKNIDFNETIEKSISVLLTAKGLYVIKLSTAD